MKKLISLFSLIIFCQMLSLAQNPYDEKISFSYIRTPLEPLSEEIKSFSVIANVAYADEIAMQIENWEKEKQERIEQNQAEKEEYKEKSLGSKLIGNVLLDEGKPKTIEIGDKYFSNVYNDADVTSRIKLEGYESTEDSDLKIEVTLQGFEYLIEEEETEKKKDDVVTKEYSYKISYKHPIEVKLFDSFDAELKYLEMPEFKDFKVNSTKKFTSSYALENYWKENKISYLKKLDDKTTKDNLKIINDYLNNQFGYTMIKRTSSIAMIKPKKYEYPEYLSAYEQIFTGYSYLKDNNEEAANYIKEAINYWEEALKESNIEDNKARIDMKVSAVTHLNCAEAYCWVNDFQNARRHIMKVKMLKTRKYDRDVEACQNLIEDQEKRFNASVEN